jgi:serine/threonine protein kinase
MHIEQVDRHCDAFEHRLKNGEKLTVEQFIHQNALPVDDELLEELHKLEQEYLRHFHDDVVGDGALDPPIDNRATEPFLPGGKESVIGHYKLLQKIGEGGMGVVYMAEQTQPVSRRVALKVVKPGMDSREVLARFEAERQALALMDHPNMARVLDAGTTDKGLPYFVMELVKGIPITAYCDERQLSIKDRLELFLPVCNAVQHAHQKGIIHRDIKPSNVLVAQYDNRSVPKIIDFGLAKAIGQKLTEKTIFTQYGQIVGTVDYMSPEQASFNQLDVDTRSDIYSLGVLLYELLSGETPFDKKRLRTAAFDELLRIIRQEEPPRPSTRLSSNASLPSIAANRRLEPKKLRHLMRGELDWIVMKAMDKERDRRYQAAIGLADDIRHYLAHEAVLACPPSPGYRFRKFARRNRALMASALAVFTALLLGLAGTSWALVRAIEAETRATRAVRNLNIQLKQAPPPDMSVKTPTGTSSATPTHSVGPVPRSPTTKATPSSSEATSMGISENRRSELFEQRSRGFLDRLTAEVIRDPRLKNPDLQPLRRKLLDEMVRFWDQIIADAGRTGRQPHRMARYYRLERAICGARAGEHKAAFDEARAVASEGGPDKSRTLARLCALCASAAENEPALAALYIDEGVRFLRQAAGLGNTIPLAADDPDLAALASHEDFLPILETWRENWSQTKAAQSQPSQKPELDRTKQEGEPRPPRRLPAYYNQVVTPQQRDKIYSIQHSYAERIEALQVQLKELQSRMDADVKAVLTPEQLRKVEELTAVAEAKSAQSQSSKASSTTQKPELEQGK